MSILNTSITVTTKKITISGSSLGDPITIDLNTPTTVRSYYSNISYGPQGFQGPAGPTGSASTISGSQGIQGEQGLQGEAGPPGQIGPVGPIGYEGPIGNPRPLTDIVDANTTLPITASTINAITFIGDLQGTSSWASDNASYAISASYALTTKESPQGSQSLEILSGMPQQLYFNTCSIEGSYMAQGEYWGSDQIKWSFTAPVSGKVILSLGNVIFLGINTISVPVAPTAWFRGYLSTVDPGGSDIIISPDDINLYNLTDQTELFKTTNNNDAQSDFLISPHNYLVTGLTPGNSYNYYAYFRLVISGFWEWKVRTGNATLFAFSVI